MTDKEKALKQFYNLDKKFGIYGRNYQRLYLMFRIIILQSSPNNFKLLKELKLLFKPHLLKL